MHRKQVEIFTAGCPVCEPVVQLVNEMASDSCDITIYNLNKATKLGLTKKNDYAVKRLPAIAVDGKLLSCCTDIEITKQDLEVVGISKK